ncbi:MAG: glycosyltransferase family 4 protein [Pyrinomonadaceae bacterium]
MKVLAIVPSIYDTSPGQRFRIEQWEPILKAGGVEIAYEPFESPELRSVLYGPGNSLTKVKEVTRSFRRRGSVVSAAGGYDLIYLFREAALLGPAWYERRFGRTGVPVVFDFDDAVFVAYRSPSNGYLSYLKFPGKTATICRIATHVIAGNPYLADYAREHNPNVTIVPTTIDTDKYEAKEKPAANDGPVTIGWSGSFSTVQHLDTVRDALQELAKTESFRLRVIGTPEYSLPGVETEAMPWRSETEIADLSAIDIGLMPLPDENWTRGKCALKALQYMALGIPTVCSPVGVNTAIIDDGVNGFLAGSRDEWINKLRTLLHSPDLRRMVGLEGRKTVEEGYSARSQAPRVLEIFQRAAKTRAGK